MEANATTVALSRGFFALLAANSSFSTLAPWMDGTDAKVHFAVRRRHWLPSFYMWMSLLHIIKLISVAPFGSMWIAQARLATLSFFEISSPLDGFLTMLISCPS
jgi:hypothetical protein